MNTSTQVGQIRNVSVLKQKPDGTPYVRFEIGVPRRSGGAIDFIDCVAWNKTAQKVSESGVGTKVAVTGSIYTSSVKEDGTSRKLTELSVTSVEFL